MSCLKAWFGKPEKSEKNIEQQARDSDWGSGEDSDEESSKEESSHASDQESEEESASDESDEGK